MRKRLLRKKFEKILIDEIDNELDEAIREDLEELIRTIEDSKCGSYELSLDCSALGNLLVMRAAGSWLKSAIAPFDKLCTGYQLLLLGWQFREINNYETAKSVGDWGEYCENYSAASSTRCHNLFYSFCGLAIFHPNISWEQFRHDITAANLRGDFLAEGDDSFLAAIPPLVDLFAGIDYDKVIPTLSKIEPLNFLSEMDDARKFNKGLLTAFDWHFEMSAKSARSAEYGDYFNIVNSVIPLWLYLLALFRDDKYSENCQFPESTLSKLIDNFDAADPINFDPIVADCLVRYEIMSKSQKNNVNTFWKSFVK